MLAGAARRAGGNPRGLEDLFARGEQPTDEDSLARKLLRVIDFYERRLSPRQSSILGIVSLFRGAVGLNTIKMLAKEVRLPDQGPGTILKEDLFLELRTLCDSGLLVSRGEGPDEAYTCHPAFRDYFRRGLLGHLPPTILEHSRSGTLDGTDTLALLLVAVESLLTSGDFVRADEVFRRHLEDGRLFLKMGELEAGVSCVLEFIRDKERKQLCADCLSDARLVFYHRMAGLFLFLVGNVEEARRYHSIAADHADCRETLQILLNHSLILSLQGDLLKGECVAQAAWTLASESGEPEGMQHCALLPGFRPIAPGQDHRGVAKVRRSKRYCGKGWRCGGCGQRTGRDSVGHAPYGHGSGG